MRILTTSQIEQAVRDALFQAHFQMDAAIDSAVKQLSKKETTDLARSVLSQITENYAIAASERIPICQDSGMTLIYAQVGQQVYIDGNFEAAVQAGVRRAHKEGYLRASVVKDPLFHRNNTTDGTPAIIYTRLVPGDHVTITAVAKGFGSENNSEIRMFIPATPLDEIKDYIVNTVLRGAAKSCPPVIVGVGIGGTMDKAADLAKRATFRSIDEHHPMAEYAALETELLKRINSSGIGPAGLGGQTTTLAVNIETFPTHIASVPVAVNLCCHASRHGCVTV